MAESLPWTGAWVTERLDVRLREAEAGEESGAAGSSGLRELAGLALRRNPKRAHLIVSPVLGKHVPVDPRRAIAAARLVGERAVEQLDGRAEPVVLGYAETATGLGHCVADVVQAPYLHSTRRRFPGRSSALGFEEQHSHATSHALLPDDAGMLDTGGPVILVDDELTTGATVLNTIAALEQRSSHQQYVVATLLDLRPATAVAEMECFADELGLRIDVVSMGRGQVELPEGVLERGVELAATLPAPSEFSTRAAGLPAGEEAGRDVSRRRVRRLELTSPERPFRHGGRHGFTMADGAALSAQVGRWAAQIDVALRDFGAGEGSVHLLGTEELMYLPLRLAAALAEARAAIPEAGPVTFSSTTRSPIAVVDDPGYAIDSAISFIPHDTAVIADGVGPNAAPRFAYNLGAGRFDQIVVVLDPDADTEESRAAGGLIEALASVATQVLVVVLPAEEL